MKGGEINIMADETKNPAEEPVVDNPEVSGDEPPSSETPVEKAPASEETTEDNA